MFSAIKNSLAKNDQEKTDQAAPQIFDQTFFQRALQSGQSARLQNGIGFHAKTYPDRFTSVVGLYIKGGEAYCAQKEPGLEAVLASVLAQNARKACAQKIHSGQMKNANVNAQCEDISSLVTVECLAGDEGAALEALAEAMIFCDIVPAEVDVYLSSRKSLAGIKNFYKSPLYKALYAPGQEILNNVSYTQILEAYAKFIDAGRLEIIAVGNFSFEGLAQKAQEVFGGLSSSWEEKALLAQAKPIAKNSLRVKIKHTSAPTRQAPAPPS